MRELGIQTCNMPIVAFVICFAIGVFPCMSDSVSKGDEDTILALRFLQKWDGSVKASPDGENVAYVLSQNGGDRKVLYIMNLESGQRFDLDDNAFSSYQPQWSPDGRRIAFTLYSPSTPYGAKREDTGCYILDIASKKMTKAYNTSSDLLWSPDGSRILFEDSGTLLDVTNMETRIILNSLPGARWSPMGDLIAFVSGFFPHPAIVVMDSEAKELRKIATASDAVLNLRWLPDGDRIAFESACQIFAVDTRGQGEPRQLTTVGGNTRFQISPDGGFIVFESDRDGDREIYLAQTDGAGDKRLTRNPGYDEHPVWVDSNRIGFVSDREGKPVFCVTDKEGSIKILNPRPPRDRSWIAEILDIVHEEIAHEMTWGYFNDARYEDSLRMSSFLNRKWYRYADVHFLRGASRFKLGNCAQAMMDLETAAQQEESRYRMYAMEYLADCYRSSKDYDRAIQLYEEIRAQYPTGSGHTEVPIKLPKTKEEKLEYIRLHQDRIIADLQSEIISNYTLVADLYPQSQMAIEALYRLGRFYQQELKELEKAEESYLKALELCGENEELGNWQRKIQEALAEIEDGK